MAGSDDVLWAGILVCGLFVALSYYALAYARSTRKRLARLEGTFDSLEAALKMLRVQLVPMHQAAASKLSSSDVEAMCSRFLSKNKAPAPKAKSVVVERVLIKSVVKRRG